MKKMMTEAFELKRKGYYKQAIEIYYKLLSKENDDIEIMAELADLYYLLKNNERAKHYISKSLEINPAHIGSLSVLLKVYMAENDFESAEETARRIYSETASEGDLSKLLDVLLKQFKYSDIIELTETSGNGECLYKKALALYNLKRYDEIIQILDRAEQDFELNPVGLENVLQLKSKIFYEQNNMKEAKEVFKRLEKNGMQTAESLNYIGLDKLDELKLDEALECFNKAISLDEKNPHYVYNMGQAYFLKGWIDEAKKCFNTAICLNPMEEKYHYSLAYLYYKIGNFEGAKAHLNPEYFDSKILIQLIKAEQGDFAAPKVELEKMLNEHPDNVTILYALARIYYNLDMYKQSKTLMDKVIELGQNNFDYITFSIRLLLKLGMTEEADLKTQELIEKYPNYYYAHVLRAETYLEKKDYEELYDEAQELIELDINHFEGYYYNALSLFEREDVNFAIESLKKAISLDVNNADLYVKMSEFYQAIGKYEDAFAYIKEASDIDKSAKNRELYMQLANILRRKGISG